MTSLVDRAGAWVTSSGFAVTLTALVVALAAGTVVFETAPGSRDGYFLVFLAGIAVPTIYEEQWTAKYDDRRYAVLWALFASLSLIAAYLAVATVLRTAFGEAVATAGAFVVVWLAGIVGARVLSGYESVE